MSVCILYNYKRLIAHIWVLPSWEKTKPKKPPNHSSDVYIMFTRTGLNLFIRETIKQKPVTFSHVYLYPCRFFHNFPSLSGSCHTPEEFFPLKIHTVIKYSAFVGTGCIWKQTRRLLPSSIKIFPNFTEQEKKTSCSIRDS